MADVSYQVKVWTLQKRKHRSGNVTYRVRWTLDGIMPPYGKTFGTFALADGYRSNLIAAARKGEPFYLDGGLPRSLAVKVTSSLSMLDLAVGHADQKWAGAAPKSRRSLASSLVTITLAMVREGAEIDVTSRQVRMALTQAFNKKVSDDGLSDDVIAQMSEIRRAVRPAADFAKPSVLRMVLDGFARNVNGSVSAEDTVRLRRVALRDLLDFGVEEKVFDTNPMDEVKVKKRNYEVAAVEPGVVANPIQGRMLIAAARERRPELAAFFGLMFYAGLRPEEALDLKAADLEIPAEGRGWLRLGSARPQIGGEWTDSGEHSEARQLKHRARGSTRSVPVASELTELLHAHIAIFGTAPDGRLFRGIRGGSLNTSVYQRVWSATRRDVFTPTVAVGPLAKRPYDLRHAALSLWLRTTGDPTLVAKWAGNSPAILLKTYAKCVSGGDDPAAEKLDAAYSA
ncbi:integrase [Amycolatopsis sp. NPDC050768]|uniref:tyrosine-type recombinase/integrase n=1 Tax=Amycolatopsis sp. NPDC050768 TaxID=3154839 RepID=UPI0033CCBE5B